MPVLNWQQTEEKLSTEKFGSPPSQVVVGVVAYHHGAKRIYPPAGGSALNANDEHSGKARVPGTSSNQEQHFSFSL